MELPKNITQIGQSNKDCKIYVEDYVVSYLKQWNRVAGDKDIAIALYGIRKEEDQVSYLFLYGACRLDFLQREVRHLSQAQQQEIEKLRVRYFPEHAFLGYRILNGEMIEGFHIGNQGTYRYIEGYAQFYEKNDSMLAYMLDNRSQDPQPEVVDREKYQAVQKRQEQRKQQAEGHRPFGTFPDEAEASEIEEVPSRSRRVKRATPKPTPTPGMRRLQLSMVAVFAFLCLAGLSTLTNEESSGGLQEAARQLVSQLTEQKLPDELPVANMEAQVDTLITEDKLVAAVQDENQPEGTGATPTEDANEGATRETAAATGNETVSQETDAMNPTSEQESQTVPTSSATPQESSTQENTTQENTPQENTPQESTPQTESTPSTEVSAPTPVAYIIQKGDTLISICRRQYGTEQRVQEICELNQIVNPDDIKIGEILLLP